MPTDSHSVVLSVSGLVLSLSRKQINKYPNTRLAQQFLHSKSGQLSVRSLVDHSKVESVTENGKDHHKHQIQTIKSNSNVVVYFFNRNPLLFMHIVDFYRTGMLHFPHHYCWTSIADELEYWRIDRSYLADCCHKIYTDHKRRIEGFREMQHIFGDDVRRFHSAVMSADNVGRYTHIRKAVAQFYNDPLASKSVQVKCYFFFYVAIVILYLLSYIMQSELDFRDVIRSEDGSDLCVEYKQWINSSLSRTTVWQSKTNSTPSIGKMIPKRVKYFISSPMMAFQVIDGFCNIGFHADLVLRYLGSVNARSFFTNSGHIMDCLCNISDLAAFCLHVSHGPNFSCSLGVLVIYLLLEVSRVVRVMRLIQFTNRYNGITVLILTLRDSMRELLLLLSVLGAGVVVFGFLIYVAELSDSQISRFDNFLIGFWFSIVTMTTLGYGEITPTTPAGYLIGSACAITGVIFVALQVPVIANKFNALYSYACDQQMREQWAKEQAIVSGEVSMSPTLGQHQSPSAFNNRQKTRSHFTFSSAAEDSLLQFKLQLQRIPTYYTRASLTTFPKEG